MISKAKQRAAARLTLLMMTVAVLTLLSRAIPEDSIFAPVWLPNAAAVAYIIGHSRYFDRFGLTGFTLAMAGTLLAIGQDIDTVVRTTAIMAIETGLVVYLIRRFCDGQPDVRKLDCYPPMLGAFAMGALVSSALANVLLGLERSANLLFLTGHFGMLLALVPPLLCFRKQTTKLAPVSVSVIVGSIAFVVCGTAAVFAQTTMPFLFLVTPTLITAGVLIGLRRTALAVLLSHVVAIVATAMGSGPILLVRGGQGMQFIALVTFMAANTMIALPVGALSRRNRMIREMLRTSRNENRYVLDNLDDVLFRIDPDGRWMSLNTAWERITGRAITESIGTKFTDFLKPEDRAEAWHNFSRMLSGEFDTMNVERSIIGRDGKELRIKIRARPARSEDGRSLGLVGHIVDVTERYQEREALEHSEQQFATLAHHAPAGIWCSDVDGNATYVSPGWLELAGLTNEEAMGPGWYDAIHYEDRDRVAEAWLRAVNAQERFSSEWRWLHKNGTEIWVTTAGAPQFDSDGRLTGYIGTNIDVTERKLAEERLAERESQLQIVADNIDDALFMIGAEGECIYASLFAGEILEMPPEQLIGRQFADMFGTAQSEYVNSRLALLRSGAAEGCELEMEIAGVGEAEDTRWLSGQIAVARDAETHEQGAIIASIRDVTEDKRLQAELTAQRERAELAVQAKSGFLANMSHEIRTPMNGVIGFTQLLMETDLDEAQQRQVRMIADSGQAMMRLLNDILDMSKIESGKLQLQPVPMDIRHKVESCVRLLEPVAREKGVELSFGIDPRLPKSIIGDPLRLRQILLNLVGNGVKFTEHGDVRIDARADFEDDEEILVLEVADTGIGIAPDKLRTIFNQFDQADGSIARRFGGTGLGLSISSQLTEMMGGTLTVKSKEGRGTSFTVRIPLIAAEDDAELNDPPALTLAMVDTGSKPTQMPEPEFANRPRVLVAEDHDINQELVMSMMSKLNLTADLAVNGRDAIERVKQADAEGRPYKLILMDMQMPEIDGLEATRRLRMEGYTRRDLPILALTANCYQDDIKACRNAGMQGHLGKPLRVEALRNAIDLYLFDGEDNGENANFDEEGQTQAANDDTPGAHPDADDTAPSSPPVPAHEDTAPGAVSRIEVHASATEDTPAAKPDSLGPPVVPTGGHSLSAKYAARKQALFDVMAKIAQTDSEGDWDDLSAQLHKLAGSAGYFGDEKLGEMARDLEERIRRIDDAQTRRSLVQSEYASMREAS
ncbi:PAS domain S-box protein [uncultured Croceicoccus sp.]|uniref:PAS domain S-box protein n=1 Tax=uncultured Croceicoccus sp. TaxID=1295329 RepID=UPI0026020551|nr:PAS domain S-box protein [uncultured Croceicoccus sp.]